MTDHSIAFCVTIAINTQEESFCPICEQSMVPGNKTIAINEGQGYVTVCMQCGLDRIDDLLGRTGLWQS